MSNNSQILIFVGTLIIAAIIWATTVLSAGLGEIVTTTEDTASSEQSGVIAGLLASIAGIFL